MSQNVFVKKQKKRRVHMNNITLLGIDLAKDVFQLHGVNEYGKKVLGKKVSRTELPKFIAKLPTCKIAMEACGSANYWSRKFMSFGHKCHKLVPSM
jgi:transposase